MTREEAVELRAEAIRLARRFEAKAPTVADPGWRGWLEREAVHLRALAGSLNAAAMAGVDPVELPK